MSTWPSAPVQRSDFAENKVHSAPMRNVFLLVVLCVLSLCSSNPTKAARKWASNLADSIVQIPGWDKSNTGCKSNSSVLIVVFPGMCKKGQDYAQLCTRLQSKLQQEGIRAHFLLPSYLNDFVGLVPGDSDLMFDAAIDLAKKQGWEYEQIVVLSHSAGGVASANTALTKASSFVQMGCHFDSRDRMYWQSRSLSSFPKPVLTLLGTRDGYLRYHSVAGEFEDLGLWGDGCEGISKKLSLEQLAVLKPVVILDEVNHQHMADGRDSPLALQTGRFDLPSALSLEEGQTAVADTIADFVVANMQGASDARKGAVSRLARRVAQARELLAPLKRMDAGLSAHLERLQRRGAGLSAQPWLDWLGWGAWLGLGVSVSALRHSALIDFIYSKPIVQDGVQCTYFEDRAGRLAVNAACQGVSPTLMLKMKSRDAVRETYPGAVSGGGGGSGGGRGEEVEVTARELNSEVFGTVLSEVTPAQRSRYLADGAPLSFEEDQPIAGGPEWIPAPIQLAVRADQQHASACVRSPVLRTPADGKQRRFAGMFYAKVVSPQQCFEWITFDAFKVKGLSPPADSV
mmetsp:Transcript_18594/g.41551  ORF Transcript_18594/g.41551 Transcript_18594/m.41551 type:complete len:571 (+) Transcript_18594:32-1744(+)